MNASSADRKKEISKIKFIRDDTAKEREAVFSEIITELKKDVELEKRIIIGRRFLKALFVSAYESKQKESLPKTESIAVKKEGIRKPTKRTVVEDVPLPPLEEGAIEDKLEYPIIATKDNENLVSVSIEYNPTGGRYSVIEPLIDQKLVEKIKELSKKEFDKDSNKLSDDKFIKEITNTASKKLGIEFKEDLINKVRYYLYRDFVFFGKLDPLLHDRSIKKITCDGTNKPIKVVDSSLKELDTNIIFTNNEEINEIINKIA
ncbi:hypothetical protein HYX19_02785, partial [Candidatus Woesearchaeota archaeon]|nr:hypothetical protein [Candidatus Woesearchaeota archaeon]